MSSLEKIDDEFVKAIIQCKSHLASSSCTTNFKRYIRDKRKDANIYVIEIEEIWKKIVIAARLFVTINDPSYVVVASNKGFARKAVLKFCQNTGATPFTGRFTPGSFTNQIIRTINEPRLIIISDTFTDKQTVLESSYVNTPCIAFCNSDNDLSFVDVVIPINNRSPLSIGCGFYLLAKAIKYIKGEEDLDTDNIRKEIEYYFYRDKIELDAIASANAQDDENKQQEIFVDEDEEVAKPLNTTEANDNGGDSWGN